ncbi:ATP-dependent Clp protease ATP-binding subunit, partial [Streptomyces sp. M-16]
MSASDLTKRADGAGAVGAPPAADRRSGPPGDGAPVTADGMMPLWAVSLDWELRRGRQVIMNGQIRDRWWFADRPASFRVVVARQLERRGAETVGWWDPVGGLTFPLAGHAERFDRLREGPPSGNPRTDDGTGTPSEPAGTRPPEGRANPEGAPDGEPGAARGRRGAERDRGRERL